MLRLGCKSRIDGYDFSKCLMDGGASLNIMYLETLERMNLTKEQLKHSNTEFHGMVPGKKANSLGSITLPVAFGDVHNFRQEKITFEVVPFKSSYHVIFGAHTTTSSTQERATSTTSSRFRVLKTTKKQISEQKTSFTAAIETKKHDLIPGATYQRTMQRCLKDQIGRNVHAYVDDIAVMTRKGSDLISDLKETFDNLRRLDEAPDASRSRNQKHGSCTSMDPSASRLGSRSRNPYRRRAAVVLQIHLKLQITWRNMRLYYTVYIAKEIGIKHIICCGDSDLVAQQVAGTWTPETPSWRPTEEVDEIAKCFLGYEVKYVGRR
ncbi:hypothetical protein QYE76_056351 [Lolium multiflorum]|uniref:Uncharacterized protein n=1 Tax=Lolium multiflorum TaxID=4521 RepID=A0AAD8T204_LOLMU|nr:hypothetical protein QYE76_056351 [Lolium multiflorum]